MAKTAHKAVNSAAQAVKILDADGFPLIRRNAMPFFERNPKTGRLSRMWGPVPQKHDAAKRYGREMAFAFLRCAPDPDHNANREAAMALLACTVIGAQVNILTFINENGAREAVYSHEFAAMTEFWETVARFACQGATHGNVKHWRSCCAQRDAEHEASLARYEADWAAERSTRARKSAIKGWAKRRKAAKRGKAVRS